MIKLPSPYKGIEVRASTLLTIDKHLYHNCLFTSMRSDTDNKKQAKAMTYLREFCMP